MVVTAGMAAYHNSFGGPFVYDDVTSIQRNQTIRRLWPPGPVLRPPCDGETVGGRPLLNLSFAVNYVLGGLDVRGYHATNLAIHIAAALLLFGILRQTFLTPPLRDRFGKAALPLALACALIWIVHPLHTESVTYIVQRAESLTGLFYLLTLYCVIRGAGAGTVPFFAAHQPAPPNTAPGEKGDCPPGQRPGRIQRARCPRSMFRDRPLLWYAAAVLACLCGMATKEVMVTAPLVVLLYDRTFLAGSLKEALRRRWVLYLGLAASWGLLAYLLFSTRLVFRQEEMGSPSAWEYARTQPGVILYYLRLSLWPKPLCFDYAWPVANSFWEIVPGAIVLAALWAATLWGLVRRRAWGFPGAWFLLILAPTSSILPLGQLAFEHRMYLSLAAVAVLAVAGGYVLWDRLLSRGERGHAPVSPKAMVMYWAAPVAAWAAITAALTYVTVARNRDYQSALAIYEDTVKKCPTNSVAHNVLGVTLAAAGRIREAIDHCRTALRLQPGNTKAHNNLGLILADQGSFEMAINHYREALRLRPDDAAPHNNWGLASAGLGRLDEAIEHYREALQLKADYAEAHNNLGNALDSREKTDEAIEHYQQALLLKPDFAEAHSNLGGALAVLGKTDEAIAHYREALRLKPDYADAHNNLGFALAEMGKSGEAIQHYRQALHLKADSPVALRNLAWLLATHEPAEDGDPAEAVRLAERLHELSGGEDARCLDALAAAYAADGRFGDAVVIAEKAVRLAELNAQTALAEKIRSRLELYRSGRPYRQPQHSPAGVGP